MNAHDAQRTIPGDDHPLNLAFQAMEVEHQLEVVDRRSTTFRSDHKFTLVAQIASRFFVREYFWTGSGSEREPVPELVTDVDVWGFPNQRIHGPLLVEGRLRTLVVDLGRTFMPGEKAKIHFQHRMKDLGGTFDPHLLARPSSRVRNRIVLRVILPPWKGLQVTYHRFTHDTEKVVHSNVLEPVEGGDEKLTYEKEIINPSKENMGHKLVWTHEGT